MGEPSCIFHYTYPTLPHPSIITPPYPYPILHLSLLKLGRNNSGPKRPRAETFRLTYLGRFRISAMNKFSLSTHGHRSRRGGCSRGQYPPPNNFENGLWPPSGAPIILSILRFAPRPPPPPDIENLNYTQPSGKSRLIDEENILTEKSRECQNHKPQPTP